MRDRWGVLHIIFHLVCFLKDKLIEKLYEELLIDPAQSKPTQHPRIFYSEEPLPDGEILQKEIQLLNEAISKHDLDSALDSMKKLVPEYNPDNGK